MRDPEVERAWLVVLGGCPNCEVEFDRFMAEAGIGMAETLWETAPRVCDGPCQYARENSTR